MSTDNFWTDEMVKDFLTSNYNGIKKGNIAWGILMEKFKQSKEEQPITKENPFTSLWYTGRREANYVFNKPVDTHQKEKIDKAIENILNDGDIEGGGKEVVGKPLNDAEVVALKGKTSGLIYTYNNYEKCWLNDMKNGFSVDTSTYKGIQDSGCIIEAVKRKSDNEIFKVKDFIKVKKDSLRKGWSDTIESFIIADDGTMIAEFETWRQPLSDIERMHKEIHVTEYNGAAQKKDAPILITDDGVNIMDKQQLVYHVTDDFKITLSHAITGGIPGSNFSTPEAAEQYILNNKPCLSLNDLLSVWSDGTASPNWYKDAPLYKNFEAKVKSKLNPTNTP